MSSPTVHYRGSVSPDGTAQPNYWAGKTAQQMTDSGIVEYDILYEIDTGRWKVFDGASDYDDLEYVTNTAAAVDDLLNVFGQVKIINMALGRLGAAPIASVEDSKPGARLALQYYRITVSEVLASYDWSSAVVRRVLTLVPDEEAGPNLTQYRLRYHIPQAPKPIRVLHLFTNNLDAFQRVDSPFRIEGDYLYTNMDNAGLVYIGDYTSNTSMLDAFIIDLIVLRLAARMCFSVTSSPQLTQQLMAEYQMRMAEAQFADSSRSRESTNLDVFQKPVDEWTAANADPFNY